MSYLTATNLPVERPPALVDFCVDARVLGDCTQHTLALCAVNRNGHTFNRMPN